MIFQPKIEWFLKTAFSHLNKPYIWAGDDPSGFDCSGFVCECLKAAGFLGEKEDYSAAGLYNISMRDTIDRPKEGALLFYLRDDGTIRHVVICLDEYYQIGASGGTRHTTDIVKAWKDNAYVKIRPIRYDPEKMKLTYLF